ncbi:OmpA family protein [Pseudoalteromonas sp. NZS100_1]|uniref:OmpA family protein n=1 Tax=Pseudoalteromonas sp. NZS100_1 TaxID=2792073 RepID=UPI0018CF39B9|nr:OmpA family protein [Pseudoalteromonas sp. NZS100_1]MBH0014301.1 OmpA family protein [Pseudoalteromonas sp. NZS100_1]
MTEQLNTGVCSFPKAYLLTGYVNEGKPISKLTPLFNRVVVADSDGAAPILLSSDEGAVLEAVDGKLLTTRTPFHAHKNRPIIVPPVDAISLLAVSQGDKWFEAFKTELGSYKGKTNTLSYQKIAVEDLQRPDTNNKDTTYSAWYNEHIIKCKVSHIYGYVIPKTRALLLSVNSSIPLAAGDGNVEIIKGTERAIAGFFDIAKAKREESKVYSAVINNNDKKLSAGLYKIRIKLNDDALGQQGHRWSHNALSYDEHGTPYYELSEMLHFDIQNEAGEFDIINCDPISVEESLIKQFPSYYTHLINFAKNTASAPEGFDPNEPKKGLPEYGSPDAKMPNSKPTAIASGFLDYCTNWELTKTRASLAAGFLVADMQQYVDADGVHHDNRGKFAKLVAKTLHTHFQTNQDPAVSAMLDATFALDSGADAWVKVREALINPSGVTTSTALSKNFWPFSELHTLTENERRQFNNTLGGTLGVPARVLNVLDKSINTANLAVSISAFSKATISYFGEAENTLNTSVSHYKRVADDYFARLSEREVSHDVVIQSLFELDSDVVSEQYQNEIISRSQIIVEGLLANPNAMVDISGYTCDIGGVEYNKKLSLRRAEAVKTILAEQMISRGMDSNQVESRMRIYGYGMLENLVDNDSESQRAINRRVSLKAYIVSSLAVSASREGLNNLERYRSLSVEKKIARSKEGDKALMAALDTALAVLSVIPHTALAARSIGFFKAVVDAAPVVIRGVAALADEVMTDNICKQYLAVDDRQKQQSERSSANQALMRDLITEMNSNHTIANSTLWAAQYRVRAEAIAGLVGLLLRAQVYASSKEDYINNAKKLEIQAYIENFLLGDEWAYPLIDNAVIKMDTFWVNLVENVNKMKSSGAAEQEYQLTYGVNQDFKLTAASNRKTLYENHVQVMDDKRATSSLIGMVSPALGFYMMSKAPVSSLQGYLETQYQKYFPIHTLGTNELDNFIDTFDPLMMQYGEANYHCSVMYYQDINTKKWHLMSDLGDESITPFTPVRVLVVFDEKMAHIAPLTFEVERIDGWDVTSIKYSELARALTKDELFINQDGFDESRYIGMVGCVFQPFYQLGPKTYLGIKPTAHQGAFLLPGINSADDYADSGRLNNMRYRITCQVAGTKSEDLPLKQTPAQGPVEFDGVFSFIEDDFLVSVDKEKHSSLLIKDYLTSYDSSFAYPELFDGEKTVTMAIRIGGEGAPFISLANLNNEYLEGPYKKTINKELYKRECSISESRNSLTITRHGNSLKIKKYDWDTEIEVFVVVTADKLLEDNYSKDLINLNPNTIPCSLSMAGISSGWLKDSELQGPTYPSNLINIGEIERSLTGGFNRGKIRDNHYKLTRRRKVKGQSQLRDFISFLKDDSSEVLSLFNWHNKKAKLDKQGQTEKKHLYVARFKLDYKTPKGNTVKGIRPFGNVDINANGSVDESPKLCFKEFRTAGNSGISVADFSTVDGLLLDDTYSHGFGLEVELPKSITSNAPWAKAMKSKRYNKLEPHLSDYQKDFYSSNDMTIDEVKEWFETHAKSLDEARIEAINVRKISD